MSFWKTLTTLALALFAVSALAQLDANAPVATVNGEDVKTGEYVHRLEYYRFDSSNALNGLPIGFLALKDMISESMVMQMAQDKGVAPSDPEISDEEQYEISKKPTLLKDYEDQGLTEADLKRMIGFDLAKYNLITFGITITDQEVEEHYHQYPSIYTEPKQYKLRVVVVGDDVEEAAVDKALAAGTSFADVASAYSLDVTKAQGGEFGTVSEDKFGGPTLQALQAVKIGDTTGWVRGSQSDSLRVKYLVEDIIPAKLQPLNDALRRKIRRDLSIDKGNVRNNYTKDLMTKTLNSKVTISIPGFQKYYDQLVAQLKMAHPAGQG